MHKICVVQTARNSKKGSPLRDAPAHGKSATALPRLVWCRWNSMLLCLCSHDCTHPMFECHWFPMSGFFFFDILCFRWGYKLVTECGSSCFWHVVLGIYWLCNGFGFYSAFWQTQRALIKPSSPQRSLRQFAGVPHDALSSVPPSRGWRLLGVRLLSCPNNSQRGCCSLGLQNSTFFCSEKWLPLCFLG